MPFVEIHDVDASVPRRRQAAQAVTDAVADAYAIAPATVDVVFHAHAAEAYGRAGALPARPELRRTFVTLHAFARPIERRREAARRITAAVAGSLGVAGESVVVYFFERRRDEAAHGGILASDEDPS